MKMLQTWWKGPGLFPPESVCKIRVLENRFILPDALQVY